MSAEDAEVGVTFWVPLPLLGAFSTTVQPQARTHWEGRAVETGCPY